MSDRVAEARAEAERQGWVNFERAAFRMGVVWADANPKPHTITRDEVEEAAMTIADFLPARGAPPAYALIETALRSLRIEVEDGDE